MLNLRSEAAHNVYVAAQAVPTLRHALPSAEWWCYRSPIGALATTRMARALHRGALLPSRQPQTRGWGGKGREGVLLGGRGAEMIAVARALCCRGFLRLLHNNAPSLTLSLARSLALSLSLPRSPSPSSSSAFLRPGSVCQARDAAAPPAQQGGRRRVQEEGQGRCRAPRAAVARKPLSVRLCDLSYRCRGSRF